MLKRQYSWTKKVHPTKKLQNLENRLKTLNREVFGTDRTKPPEEKLANLLDSLYKKKKYIGDKSHEFNGLKRGTELLAILLKLLDTLEPKCFHSCKTFVSFKATTSSKWRKHLACPTMFPLCMKRKPYSNLMNHKV